jgi:hypothetical protein
MNKLSFPLQGASFFCLLLLAQASHGQAPAQVHLVAMADGSSPALRPLPTASEAAAPLVLQPNGTPGWLSLVGVLPATAPLTADVLGTGTSPVASHTWRGLPAGRVHLALNLRNVPAGAYRLRLSQNGQQWELPLAVK